MNNDIMENYQRTMHFNRIRDNFLSRNYQLNLRAWHRWDLCGTLELRKPSKSLWRKELALWNILTWPLWVIQHAGLDDVLVWERSTCAIKGGTAISTEPRGDLITAISDLGNLLWGACPAGQHDGIYSGGSIATYRLRA